MGRLVKAFALDRESARLGHFDEKQFLHEAGLIADRLRVEVGTTTNEPSDTPEWTRRDDAHDNRYSRSQSPRGREESSDEADLLSSIELALQVGDLDEARDAVGRLRRDRDAQRRGLETSQTQAERQILDEQQRWEERHAEQARRLEQWEHRLQSREAQLHNEQQSQRGAESREQLDRARRMIEDCDRRILELAAERTAAKQEIETARAQFAAERSQHEHDFAEQKKAAELELEQRRASLTRECVEQRAALLTQRETHLRDINDAQAKQHQERAAWAKQYEQEKLELTQLRATIALETTSVREQVAELSARREKLEAQVRDLQTAHQEAVERARAEIAALVERERARLDAQRAEIERLEREADGYADRQRQTLEAELLERRTAMQREYELAVAEIAALRASALEETTADKAAIAARTNEINEQTQRVLKAQHELETLAVNVATERRLLKQEREERESSFEAALARRQQEFETALRHRSDDVEADFERQRIDFENSARQRDAELAQRERTATQRLAQQEAETQSRFRQIEHDLRLQVELAHKRLADDREHFQQQCQRRDAELVAERTELDRQWAVLNDERARIRSSLEQVDQHVRWAATSMDASNSVISAPPYSTPYLEPRFVARRFDEPISVVPQPHVLPMTVRHVESIRVEPSSVEPSMRVANFEADELAASLSAPTVEPEPRAAQAEANAGRRAALEQYRSKLGELQSQLQDLASLSKSTTTIGT